jgi:ATP-dependent Clp protease ATP-binding subunit ClpB
LLHLRLQDNDLGLTVSDAVLDNIATLGYDPVYGARPLKRVIQNRIENQLAQQMLQGDFVAGDVIAIDLDADGGLSFSKTSPIACEEAVVA